MFIAMFISNLLKTVFACCLWGCLFGTLAGQTGQTPFQDRYLASANPAAHKFVPIQNIGTNSLQENAGNLGEQSLGGLGESEVKSGIGSTFSVEMERDNLFKDAKVSDNQLPNLDVTSDGYGSKNSPGELSANDRSLLNLAGETLSLEGASNPAMGVVDGAPQLDDSVSSSAILNEPSISEPTGGSDTEAGFPNWIGVALLVCLAIGLCFYFGQLKRIEL